LPLVCLGLPFCGPGRRVLKVAACGLGFVIQLLAISVDHQRYYFERSLAPFFWTDESMMYKDSPIVARPRELIAILEGRDRARATWLVPGPRPLSMTSSIFGPPPDLLPKAPEWMRDYLVFLVPRPWTLWSRYVPRSQRPAATGLMTAIGVVTAMTSF